MINTLSATRSGKIHCHQCLGPVEYDKKHFSYLCGVGGGEMTYYCQRCGFDAYFTIDNVELDPEFLVVTELNKIRLF